MLAFPAYGRCVTAAVGVVGKQTSTHINTCPEKRYISLCPPYPSNTDGNLLESFGEVGTVRLPRCDSSYGDGNNYAVPLRQID